MYYSFDNLISSYIKKTQQITDILTIIYQLW
jgi:hypothetical protein